MPKWVWGFFLGFIVFGLILIFEGGIRPRSVKVLKPSYFSNPQELGALTYEILRLRMGNHPLLVMGGAPGSLEHHSIFEGFLDAATRGDIKFDLTTVAQGRGLDPEVVAALKRGQRVAVYTNSLDTPRFLKASLTSELETQLGIKAIAVTWLELAGPDGREPQAQCVENSKGYTHSLGCLLRDMNEFILRDRKAKWEKFVGIINLEGERDYVGYSHSPVSSSGH